jgi:hypothetical protein
VAARALPATSAALTHAASARCFRATLIGLKIDMVFILFF